MISWGHALRNLEGSEEGARAREEGEREGGKRRRGITDGNGTSADRGCVQRAA